jgi:hypothetical protein
MKKTPCPHCSVPYEQTIIDAPNPFHNPFEDQFHQIMSCMICNGKWTRIYKPSHDIKEE